jgi:hypothetical protein
MLDSAVENSGGNQGVILAAVAGHTIMELGGSVVDLARLGDGIASGGKTPCASSPFSQWGRRPK